MPIQFFTPADPSDIGSMKQLQDDFNKFEDKETPSVIKKVYVTAYEKEVPHTTIKRPKILLWCHYE